MSSYSELVKDSDEIRGMGIGDFPEVLGKAVKFVLVSSTFAKTKSQLRLKATLDTEIAAGNAFVFPEIQSIEEKTTEAGFIETDTGRSYQNKKEIRKMSYKFLENPIVHSGMKSHSGGKKYIMIYTSDGYLWGHKKANNSFGGFKLSRFTVSARKTMTDGELPYSIIDIEYDKVDDMDLEYGIINPDYDMTDLVDPTAAQAYSASSTSSTGTLTVNVTMTIRGSNLPLTGLSSANFSLKDASGTSVSITSATETGSTGVYAVVATDNAVTGTIGLNGVVTVSTINYRSNQYTFVTA